MAVVAPPGAVATALRHVRYRKQARSASDTRPHRAVPVAGAHRSRSLTCILTTAPAQRCDATNRDCATHTTRYRREWLGTYGGYITGPVCGVGSTLPVP